jgi:death on curing protein
MEYITLGDLYDIRDRIAAHDPWRFEIVNNNGLLSALATPFQGAFGVEMFPSLVDKAGALVYLLIENHPFRDGNKRIAAEAMALFLQRNGIRLEADAGALKQFTTEIASGTLRDGDVANWIARHSSPLAADDGT